MADLAETTLDGLLDAALMHVPFEGWSPATFKAAARDAGMSEAEARVVAPRGAIDLAVAYHRRCDAKMLERLAEADTADMRFSEKVALALRLRIDVMEDREAVRRATTLFSLPTHAAEGSKLIWETADRIWTALGDTSNDLNWYSKRATLAAVWASTVLYWLGDDSLNKADTMSFIDRRIDNVMRIEQLKGKLRKSPLTKPLMDLQAGIFRRVKMPESARPNDMPGRWQGPR